MLDTPAHAPALKNPAARAERALSRLHLLHAGLKHRIKDAQRRRGVDPTGLAELKKLKLALKDTIARVEAWAAKWRS